MKFMAITAALLCALSSQANAGFFDFLFGDDKAVVEQKAVQSDSSGQLMGLLADQLGVTESQAQGGMGALLQLAQSQLKPEQFSKLEQGMPELKGLLAAAPAVAKGGSTDSVNGLLSQLGGMGESVAKLNTVKSQFESLGLDTKMIAQYGSIAMEFYKSQGGETAQLIEQGLGILGNLQ